MADVRVIESLVGWLPGPGHCDFSSRTGPQLSIAGCRYQAARHLVVHLRRAGRQRPGFRRRGSRGRSWAAAHADSRRREVGRDRRRAARQKRVAAAMRRRDRASPTGKRGDSASSPCVPPRTRISGESRNNESPHRCTGFVRARRQSQRAAQVCPTQAPGLRSAANRFCARAGGKGAGARASGLEKPGARQNARSASTNVGHSGRSGNCRRGVGRRAAGAGPKPGRLRAAVEKLCHLRRRSSGLLDERRMELRLG